MKSNKTTDRKRRTLYIIILSLLMSAGAVTYQSGNKLEVNYYNSHADVSQPIRIVHLSDLHNRVFGSRNQKLVSTVKEQSPDLILITGDLINADDNDLSIARNLLNDLYSIAPVYVSLGNHEVEYRERFGADVIQAFSDTDSVVLDRAFEDIEVKGQQLRLGGIYGYCLPEKYLETGDADQEECDFLQEFQNTERVTVLMCHLPVSWLSYDGLEEWNTDYIFSGHTHGGQVIIPKIGGVYAPDMGWFPGRLEGRYSSADGIKTLVLSRGLGSTEVIPRFNNIPEIVVADLLPMEN